MKKIYRYTSIIILLVSVLTFAISASEIQLSDYMDSLDVSSGISYLTANGVNSNTNGWVESHTGDIDNTFTGDTILFNEPQDIYFAEGFICTFYPFGMSNLIPVSQFKSGYPIICDIDHVIKFQDILVESLSCKLYVEMYNANKRWFKSEIVNISSDLNYTFIPNWPDGCEYIVFAYLCDCTIDPDSVGQAAYISFTLSKAMITYAVTDSVDSIFDVITGDPGEPILPDDEYLVGDLESAEKDLMNGSSDSIQDIQDLQQTTLDFFVGFAGTFAFASALISLVFGKIGAISVLWYISLAFGIFASIVGIVAAGISVYNRKDKGGS